MGFRISINRSSATNKTLSTVGNNMDQDSLRLIRNNVRNASDHEIPMVVTLAFEKLAQSAPKLLKKRVPSFTLQNIVATVCDLLTAQDDYELEDENANVNEDEDGRTSRMSVDRRGKRTGYRDASPDPSLSGIPLPPGTPPSGRTSGPLPGFQQTYFNHYDSDAMSISSINSRTSTVDAELAAVSKAVADGMTERPRMESFWDKLNSAFTSDLLCPELPPLYSPPAIPLADAVPTSELPSSPSSAIQSWLSRANLDSLRETSPQFIPPLIDQNYNDTDPSRVKRIDFSEGNVQATLFIADPAPRPQRAVDTPTYSSDDDLTAYMEFDENDYIIMPGETLYCNVCDKDLLDVNLMHTLSTSHRVHLNAAPASSKHKVWQITAGGSVRCNVCQVEFSIRTLHTASKSHAQAKKFKTSEEITALELSVWGKLPTELLDEVAFVSNNKPGQGFCVLCQQEFETPLQKMDHQQKSMKHRAYQQQLRTRNIFTYGFGILLRNKGNGDREMQYCVLCKVGITNYLEYEYHVRGTDSQHMQRLHTFWTRACPNLSSHLVKDYAVATNEVSLYLPETPPNARHGERSIMLGTVILSKRGRLKLCCLCNQFLFMDDDGREHSETREHIMRESLFTATFVRVSKYSGLMKKDRNTYCVVCRMGFTNRLEAELHIDTATHEKRVLQFAHSYLPLFRSKFIRNCS